MSVTLDDLWAEFGHQVPVYEAHISDERGRHLHGLCDPMKPEIVINRKFSVVDSCIHELLHKKFPRRSERRIERDTEKIVQAMDRATIARWYQRFERRRRRSKAVEIEE